MGYDAITRRKINDAFREHPEPQETVESLRRHIESLGDSIRAIQSTDDLGEAMNEAVIEQENALFARYNAAKKRLAELEAACSECGQRDGHHELCPRHPDPCRLIVVVEKVLRSKPSIEAAWRSLPFAEINAMREDLLEAHYKARVADVDDGDW